MQATHSPTEGPSGAAPAPPEVPVPPEPPVSSSPEPAMLTMPSSVEPLPPPVVLPSTEPSVLPSVDEPSMEPSRPPSAVHTLRELLMLQSESLVQPVQLPFRQTGVEVSGSTVQAMIVY